jgi:SAM-dependent methyltransferase
LFCFGVLQHTPDPRRAFLSLPRHVKPGGHVVADVYVKSFAKYVLGTTYWVRPLTKRLPPDKLYRWVRRYVDVMWPVAMLISRIPRIGATVNWRLLIADYSAYSLEGELLKEWAYLDTFDMLSPKYDSPQTLDAVRVWCRQAALEDVEVEHGYNGIEMRGTRPARTGASAT